MSFYLFESAESNRMNSDSLSLNRFIVYRSYICGSHVYLFCGEIIYLCSVFVYSIALFLYCMMLLIPNNKVTKIAALTVK